MWQRRTFHDCANELASISERFRLAYTDTLPPHMVKMKNGILEECSKNGVDVLKVLALSIRSEQDYGILPNNRLVVGAQKEPVTDGNIYACKKYYCGQYKEYCETKNYEPMYLRVALNKIAHANPIESSFYADEQVHDLILIGTYRDRKWIALLSLLDLIKVVKELPDRNIP